MGFGVDSTGFIPKTVTDVTASLAAGYRAVYGAAVNVAARSRIGQRIALFAGALAEVWELGETLFNATDPDAATDTSLDNLLKLAGLTRKPATFSTVALALTGTPSTVVAAGKRAAIPATTTKFALNSNATIASTTAWAGATIYALGAIVKNGGNIYVAATAGTSAASGGPTGTGAGIVDGINGLTWNFVGPGIGYVSAPATATATGPLNGFAGTVNTIDTPVSGWSGVTNLTDASPGSNVELDADARARRELSQSKGGANSLSAVRAAVLDLNGVTSCTIFENTGDVTVDGVPPHSFETLVEGGDPVAIAQAIFNKRPGGIRAYGTTAETISDSESNSYTIAFSRPDLINITVSIQDLYDGNVYPPPSFPDTAIQDALVLRQNAQKVGKDVVVSSIIAGLFRDVPGLIDIPVLFVALTSGGPLGATTLPMTPRQKATFDTSRISVQSSPGSF